MSKKETALINLYTLSYHSKYKYKIYNDIMSIKLITDEEFNKISNHMEKSIKYFNPSFSGPRDDKIRYMVDNYYSPFILERNIYNIKMLLNEIKLGCKQYIVLNGGYDTSCFKVNNLLKIFLLDNDDIIKDYNYRIENTNNIKLISSNIDNYANNLLQNGFDKTKKTYCSLFGISYYLSKKEFEKLLFNVSNILCDGSTIIFDYPIYDDDIINNQLLSNSNEAKYSMKDIEKILDKNNLLMYENINNKMINNKYFYNYNTLNPKHKILSPTNINYCFAIKKDMHSN